MTSKIIEENFINGKMIEKEKTPKQWILKEFEDLNREYNEIVDSHFEKTTLRFLFTIAGIGLGLGGALVNPMMSAWCTSSHLLNF